MTTSWERLAGPVSVGTASVDLFTVPAQAKAVVRAVELYDSSASGTQQAFIALSPGGTSKRIICPTVPASGFVSLVDLRLVLYAGEKLIAVCAHASVTITVNGFLVPV